MSILARAVWKLGDTSWPGWSDRPFWLLTFVFNLPLPPSSFSGGTLGDWGFDASLRGRLTRRLALGLIDGVEPGEPVWTELGHLDVGIVGLSDPPLSNGCYDGNDDEDGGDGNQHDVYRDEIGRGSRLTIFSRTRGVVGDSRI